MLLYRNDVKSIAKRTLIIYAQVTTLCVTHCKCVANAEGNERFYTESKPIRFENLT